MSNAPVCDTNDISFYSLFSAYVGHITYCIVESNASLYRPAKTFTVRQSGIRNNYHFIGISNFTFVENFTIGIGYFSSVGW